MANFEEAWKILLQLEGSRYVPNDEGRGGAKYGVTQATLNDVWERFANECVKLGLPLTTGELTEEQAKKFYRRFFWDPLGLDACPNECLARLVFTVGVHMGLRHGAAAVQTGDLDKALEYVMHRYDNLLRGNAKYKRSWTYRVVKALEGCGPAAAKANEWRNKWIKS